MSLIHLSVWRIRNLSYYRRTRDQRLRVLDICVSRSHIVQRAMVAKPQIVHILGDSLGLTITLMIASSPSIILVKDHYRLGVPSILKDCRLTVGSEHLLLECRTPGDTIAPPFVHQAYCP